MACSDVKKFVASWRGGLLLLGGLGVAVLVGWALWRVPQWQAEYVKEYPYELAKLEDEYRRTFAQSIGGFFLLVGLYLGWLRVKAAQETVRVAEEGQITERFTRAIQQLGDDENMAIRLGGIYALERIARDSEKDHGPIMEVLTAYVREKATKGGKYAEEAAQEPTTDIQALLTVIGRRETTGKGRRNDRLDLGNTHLYGVVIPGADLSGADLSRADLSEADLSRADLSGAYLSEADLREADLRGADLSRADLSGAENLTEEQVRSATNWYKATLPDYLPDSVKDLTSQGAALPD